MVRESRPIWLYIAALPLVLGILYSNRPAGTDAGWLVGLVGAGLCVVAYFLTGTRHLILASAGTSITISTGGRDTAKFHDFVSQVDAAKNDRYLLRLKEDRLV